MGGLFGGKTIRTEGNKIANFQVNSATYGVVVPVVMGTTRMPVNIVDYYDFIAVPHTTTQRTGKGGTKTKNTSYTYTVACLLGLCEGPIYGIGKVWKDKEVFLEAETTEEFDWQNNTTVTVSNWVSTKSVFVITGTTKTIATPGTDYNDIGNGQYAMLTGTHDSIKIVYKSVDPVLGGTVQAGLTLFKGNYGQSPWSYTTSKHPEKALPYSGLAYLAGVMDLGDSAGLPTLNFEVKGQLLSTGDNIDVNPADAINYIIFDEINGVGFGTGGIDSAGLTRFRTFCKAADLLVSTPPDLNKKAYEIINDICTATNTIGFWSQNRLKLVPLCDETLTRNGVTYTPNTTPEYDLTEDDFLPMDDGRLVIWEREDGSEAFNQATVEFINRANSYEVETVDYQVLVDVNRRGLRPADTEEIHYLYTKERAQYVAQLKAMKSLYGRNKYRFKLDWSFCRLEPGDLLTLTETSNGLNRQPVIIDNVTEADDGELEFLAIAKPPGIYSPARYTVHQAERAVLNSNADPGDIKTPLFFETPFLDGSHNIGVAVCGQTPAAWGGAYVWVSFDDEAYQQVGQVSGPSRYGKIIGAITNVATTVVVQLTDTNTQLLSASATAADANATLIAVGLEWMAYETATLVGAGQYQLAGLRRGLYGSAITAHANDEDFLRYDVEGFLYPYQVEDIGRDIFIKLTPYNIFGLNAQSLEDATAYGYTIRGAGSMTRIERATKTINPAGWTAFTFTKPFNNVPSFAAWCQTVGGSVYWRNVTTTGFEALIQIAGVDAIGEFIYEAQGW